MKRHAPITALLLSAILVLDCASYRSNNAIKNRSTTVRIVDGVFLISSVGIPGASAERIEKRDEAYRAALYRIENQIRIMPVQQIIEKFIGATLEGAAGAADYSSTGIALSKELTGGMALHGRSAPHHIGPIHTETANKLSSIPKTGMDILKWGTIVTKRFEDNNCEIVYRIHPRDLVLLINSYNRRLNTELYDRIDENDFLSVSHNPLSTFSIDVDTASYSNVRRFLHEGRMPPKGAVRIEEMINYFTYAYPSPEGRHPFSIISEVAVCPWNTDHRLVLLALQGKSIEKKDTPPRNLVLLIDVSGSMYAANKLPLLKRAMRLLIKQLTKDDYLAIVAYAGAAGMVLPPTEGTEKRKILSALINLHAGGCTNGGDGIRLAYRLARKNFHRKGINRVVLVTDGDFNVGTTSQDELIELIEKERRSGVFLTVLGFGMGNLKDSTMEKLADRGNGNYAYIDTINEAQKVLVHEIGATLITIAQDVKVQVEFNPERIQSYRLIGYENRLLQDKDFNDDRKDSGDLGAGHSVTVLYEVVPVSDIQLPGVNPLRYQTERNRTERAKGDEILFLKLRYKDPEAEKSKIVTVPVSDSHREFNHSSINLRFAASVAGFGMILRDSKYKGTLTLAGIRSMARSSIGDDRKGYRTEFLGMVRLAESVKE